ncbi:MAG: DUF1648 domain-containing protein [Bacillota bacterium]|nr:DUF1648 domain-containing protein [Bacillota bacterium]
MKRNKAFKLGLALSMIPFIINAVFYSKLPDQIATHFDINGVPDNYSSKNFALFGLPAIMLAIYVTAYVITNLDPKRKNQGDKALNIVLIFLPLMSIVISIMTIAFTLGKKIDIPIIMASLVSLMLILIGNYLPKVKRNYTIGVKLPWTLDSDYVWDKTHKLAGKVFILGGLGLLLNTIFYNKLWSSLVIVAIIIFIPGIYSYVIYKNQASSIGDDEDEE